MKRLTIVLAAGMLAVSAFGQSKKPTAKAGETTLEAKRVSRAKRARRPRRMSTRQLLNLRVDEISLEAVPFEQVTEWLADYTGVNFLVRWSALEDVGVEAIGIPRPMFSATFAVARVAGWCAHIAEQRATGRLIRPKSRYIGTRPAA